MHVRQGCMHAAIVQGACVPFWERDRSSAPVVGFQVRERHILRDGRWTQGLRQEPLLCLLGVPAGIDRRVSQVRSASRVHTRHLPLCQHGSGQPEPSPPLRDVDFRAVIMEALVRVGVRVRARVRPRAIGLGLGLAHQLGVRVAICQSLDRNVPEKADSPKQGLPRLESLQGLFPLQAKVLVPHNDCIIPKAPCNVDRLCRALGPAVLM